MRPTFNLVTGWKEADIGGRYPPSVAVIKLYHNTARFTFISSAT